MHPDHAAYLSIVTMRKRRSYFHDAVSSSIMCLGVAPSAAVCRRCSRCPNAAWRWPLRKRLTLCLSNKTGSVASGNIMFSTSPEKKVACNQHPVKRLLLCSGQSSLCIFACNPTMHTVACRKSMVLNMTIIKKADAMTGVMFLTCM